MLERLSDIGDNLHRQDQVAVLAAPVDVAGGMDHTKSHRCRIASQLDSGRAKGFDGGRQERRRNRLVHQQGLDGVAGRRVLGLAVDCHPQGLLEVGGGVDVQMADAIGVAQHRDAGVVLDEPHQGVGTPGNDQIHEPVELEQTQAFFAAGQQLEGGRVDGAGCQRPRGGSRPAAEGSSAA